MFLFFDPIAHVRAHIYEYELTHMNQHKNKKIKKKLFFFLIPLNCTIIISIKIHYYLHFF